MTWLVSGVRTPFAKVDGALRSLDAASLSIPVAQAMSAQLAAGDRPDLMVWGTVAPNLANGTKLCVTSHCAPSAPPTTGFRAVTSYVVMGPKPCAVVHCRPTSIQGPKPQRSFSN